MVQRSEVKGNRLHLKSVIRRVGMVVLVMMDKDGVWLAVVIRNLVVILFVLRCQAVGKAAKMGVISCHS